MSFLACRHLSQPVGSKSAFRCERNAERAYRPGVPGDPLRSGAVNNMGQVLRGAERPSRRAPVPPMRMSMVTGVRSVSPVTAWARRGRSLPRCCGRDRPEPRQFASDIKQRHCSPDDDPDMGQASVRADRRRQSCYQDRDFLCDLAGMGGDVPSTTRSYRAECAGREGTAREYRALGSGWSCVTGRPVNGRSLSFKSRSAHA